MCSFKEFRFFIYSVTLLAQPLYWSVSSLMGRDLSIHDSAGGSFVIYNVVLFALTILFSFKDIKIGKLNTGNRFLLGVIVFYVFAYFFEVLISDATDTEWFNKSFLFFILFGISGALIGVVFSQNGISKFYKHIDLLTFIIGVGYIRSIPMMLVTGDMLGGYQDISYYSALSFGFLLYGFISNKKDRFFIFKYSLSRYLSIVLGVFLIVCVLSSGGRGGLVLLFVEIVFCVFSLLKKNIGSTILLLSACFLLFFITSTFIQKTAVGDIVNIGMERGLSYFDSGKIDVTETSNRDVIYKEHMNRIKENPFVGEGIYTVLGKHEWPHNFFIELLASGGVFFLFFWILILIKCFKVLKRIIKIDKNNQYLVPLILYLSVVLLFSTSYIVTRIFWFVISLLLSEIINTRRSNLSTQ